MSVERERLAKSLSKYVEKYAVSGAGDEWKTYFGEDLANEWLRVNIPATFTQADLDAAVAKARLDALEEALAEFKDDDMELNAYQATKQRIIALKVRESSREREPQEKEGHPFGNSY